PQTIDTKKSFKEYGDWIGYLGKDALSKHGQYVDRIGNYTLLGQKLNIKASNNPFRAKKKEYKKSNIRLTTQLEQEFSRFKFKQVEKRAEHFSEKAVVIWNL
ncbi:MAG: HNH endonuclease family protein, partial [Candidatus Omnitrophica bacterium]|nr:HNH endonuclease family protein [Candidatus Omnitrophota bacterium]